MYGQSDDFKNGMLAVTAIVIVMSLGMVAVMHYNSAGPNGGNQVWTALPAATALIGMVLLLGFAARRKQE